MTESRHPAPGKVASDRIKRAIKRTGATQKATSTVSSNISSGFKSETDGLDYKRFFDDGMRSKIAGLGAYYGVPYLDLVDFVVAVKDLDPATKNQLIDELLP